MLKARPWKTGGFFGKKYLSSSSSSSSSSVFPYPERGNASLLSFKKVFGLLLLSRGTSDLTFATAEELSEALKVETLGYFWSIVVVFLL